MVFLLILTFFIDQVDFLPILGKSCDFTQLHVLEPILFNEIPAGDNASFVNAANLVKEINLRGNQT